MSGGRPFWFIGLSLGGWTVVRIVLLWPQAEAIRDLIHTMVPAVLAQATPQVPSMSAVPGTAPRPAARPVAWRAHPLPRTISVAPIPLPRAPASLPVAIADRPAPSIVQPRGPVPPALPDTRPAASRWSAGGWAILRDGGIGGIPGMGQLGGAQGGVRIAYALGRARRLSLAARVSTPLRGIGREAAVGLDWRPTRLPVRIVAEQRIALDGGRGGPMVGLVGGIDPTPVAAGFRLEAYGQAGAIARDGVEGFVDGAVRVARPLAQAGSVRIDLGVGGWGGAQRGAARLDIGPSLGVVVPVARRSLRLTLDWRERVAGDARPGSGPALSLGTDF